MANTHIPKYGFSSRGCDGRGLPRHFCYLCCWPGKLFKCDCHGRNWFFRNYAFITRSLVFYLVLLVCASKARGITFEGEVDTMGFRPGQDSPVESKKARFNITVDGCRWLVRVVEEGNPYDYIECGGDGREVYSLIGLTNLNQNLLNQGKKAGANSGAGFIQSGSVPHSYRSPYASVLWLAYASSCYFNSITNGLAEPLLFFVLQDRQLHQHGFHQRVDLKWFDGVPRLLSAIAYYDDGNLYYWDNDDLAEIAPPLKKIRIPPYNKGFTNAYYSVTAITNLDNNNFPKRFRFDVYHTKQNAKNNGELFLLRTFSGVTTSVQMGTALPDHRPEVLGMITVSDQRIVKSGESPRIEYQATNRWPKQYELDSNPEYRDQIKIKSIVAKELLSRKSNLDTGKRRPIILACLAAIMLGSFGVFWLFQRRATKS